jgi:hypothetical protein
MGCTGMGMGPAGCKLADRTLLLDQRVVLVKDLHVFI